MGRAAWARPGCSWWMGGRVVCERAAAEAAAEAEAEAEAEEPGTGAGRTGGEGSLRGGAGRAEGWCGDLPGSIADGGGR